MDTEEQEQFIDDLRKQSAMLNKIWRLVMIIFGGVLVLFYVYASVCLVLMGPTYLAFHEVFAPKMGSSTLLLLQMGSLMSICVTIVYARALPRPRDDHFTATWVAAGAIALCYLLMMLMRDAHDWYNLWHPVLPLLYAGMTTYAESNAKKFDTDIACLEALKYKYASL